MAGGCLSSRLVDDLIVGTFAMERAVELAGEGLVALFPTETIWGGRSGEGLCTGLVAGDVNGDGFDDLLIDAPASRDAGGRGYLFYGEGLGLSGVRIARWNLYR